MATTVATVKQLFADTAKVALDSSTLTNAILDRWNRYFYQRLYESAPLRYVKSSTISVVANTAGYNLPTDFLTIDSDECGVYELNTEGAITTIYTPTDFGSLAIGYYLTNAQIVFTPLPGGSKTITLRYIPTIASLTSDSGNIIIPDRYKMLMVYVLARDDAFVNYAPDVDTGQWSQLADELEKEMLGEFPRDVPRIRMFGYNDRGYVPYYVKY